MMAALLAIPLVKSSCDAQQSRHRKIAQLSRNLTMAAQLYRLLLQRFEHKSCDQFRIEIRTLRRHTVAQ